MSQRCPGGETDADAAPAAGSGGAAALTDDPPPIAFGRAAPDAGLLADRQGVFETRRADAALGADGLGGDRIVVVVGVEDHRVEPATRPEIPPLQLLY